MSRLFRADQLCRRQCSLYSAYNQASVDLRSWLIPLSGNVFAYWYSNTRYYAIKWYAIKRYAIKWVDLYNIKRVSIRRRVSNTSQKEWKSS